MRRALAACLLIAPLACDDEVIVDPIYEPAPDWCDEAPLTTWNNWGRGFLVQNCNTCHAATAGDRHEAPDDMVFDTSEDVALRKAGILTQATGDAPEMPPSGGVSATDRARLEAWLRCDFDPDLEL